MDYVYEHFNNYHRPDKVYENTSLISKDDEIITEQGYMPVKVQVQRFMEAGVVLQAYKRSLWDDTGVEKSE